MNRTVGKLAIFGLMTDDPRGRGQSEAAHGRHAAHGRRPAYARTGCRGV